MGASLVEGVIMGDMVKSLSAISILDLSGFGIKPSRPSAAAASIQLSGLTALTWFLFFSPPHKMRRCTSGGWMRRSASRCCGSSSSRQDRWSIPTCPRIASQASTKVSFLLPALKSFSLNKILELGMVGERLLREN